MKLSEVIGRIQLAATESLPEGVRPELMDTGVLAEVILPRCLEALAEKWLRSPQGLEQLRMTIPLTFVAGTCPLPSNFLEKAVDTITVIEDPTATHVPSWSEFTLDPQTGNPVDYSRFAIWDGNVYYHQRNAIKGSFSGSLSFLMIARPELPTVLSDDVQLRDSALQELIIFTASVVNGQTRLSEIGLDYGSLVTVQKRAPQVT